MQRHHHQCHQHVRGGQRHNEVVLHFLQRSVAEHCQDDQGVSEDGTINWWEIN